jgi:hypothetical protein
MLDCTDAPDELIAGSREHMITLPPALNELLQKRGPLPPAPDDLRKHPRFYCPVSAILEYRRNVPSLPRDGGRVMVLIKDISRSGWSLLHVEQLYPGEEFTLQLPNGSRECRVIRCRHHTDSCFEVAGLFV